MSSISVIDIAAAVPAGVVDVPLVLNSSPVVGNLLWICLQRVGLQEFAVRRNHVNVAQVCGSRRSSILRVLPKELPCEFVGSLMYLCCIFACDNGDSAVEELFVNAIRFEGIPQCSTPLWCVQLLIQRHEDGLQMLLIALII